MRSVLLGCSQSSWMRERATRYRFARHAGFEVYARETAEDALAISTMAISDPLILTKERPPLLRNDGGDLQNWIKIKSIGTKCNYTAIGGHVRVITGTHPQMNEAHSGSSLMSQSDLQMHSWCG